MAKSEHQTRLLNVAATASRTINTLCAKWNKRDIDPHSIDGIEHRQIAQLGINLAEALEHFSDSEEEF